MHAPVTQIWNHLEARLGHNPAPEVSFVLPCLNEALTVSKCVSDAFKAIAIANTFGEVIVADNGSTDGSQALAGEAGADVVNVRALGYGNALMGGICAARGRYVVMADCDLSYDLLEMPKFLKPLRQGYDLVMGCRLPGGGGVIEPGAMPWSHRYVGNPVLSGLGRWLFNTSVIDFHCGFRGFERKRVLTFDLQATGMEFASEMVIKASLLKVRTTQVPVTLKPDGRGRSPHLRTWRDGWRHLRLMLSYASRTIIEGRSR